MTERNPEMPIPVLWDHLVVVALLAVLPVHGVWEYRRLMRRVRAGSPDARLRVYRMTIVSQWALTAGIVGFWWATGRGAAGLGLAVPGGGRLVAGVAVTVLGLGFLLTQWRAVTAMDENGLAALRAQFASVGDLLPRTAREGALFRWLSLTAGVCEEIVYRGYLIWYLGAFMGAWAGAAVAGVAFGALHAYQGKAGAVRTGLVGLGMGALYVGTGSLLWPMILHTAIDVQGGAVGRRVLAPATAAAEPARA